MEMESDILLSFLFTNLKCWIAWSKKSLAVQVTRYNYSNMKTVSFIYIHTGEM